MTVLQGCHGNVKPMNKTPLRESKVGMCEIDSRARREGFVGLQCVKIEYLVGNVLSLYISLLCYSFCSNLAEGSSF